MANIKYRQMELLMQAGQEKEEARRQLEMEKGKLKEMEKRHKDNQQKCDMYSSLDDGSHGSEMDRMLKQESDALEIQKKLLDDLEFHLLELETRREEEREPVVKALSAEHAQISKTVAEENERLRKILQQKTDLVDQFKSDIDDFESERQLLVDSFKTSIIQDEDVDNEEFLRTPHSLLDRLSEIDAIDLTVCSKQDNLDDTSSDVVNGSRHNSVEDNFSANSSPTKETPRLQTMNGYVGTNGWSPGGAKHEGLKDPTSRGLDRSSSTEGYTDPFEDNQRTTMINYESSRVLPSLDYICPRTNGTHDSGVVQFTNGTQDSGVVKFRQNSYRAQCRPLTRYLPIRDRRDLDLRQFIEGCGHNLDENDDVRLSSTCCRGYLSKMGTKFRTWNRRWFVLDRTLRTIVYYLDRNETKARGLIRFSDIEDVFVDHMKTARKGLSTQLNFCLKTRKRTFYLAAVSGETMRIWIDVMFTGAEGYNEYM